MQGESDRDSSFGEQSGQAGLHFLEDKRDSTMLKCGKEPVEKKILKVMKDD